MVVIKDVEVYGLSRAMFASGNPMSVGDIKTAYQQYDFDKDTRCKKLGSSKGASGHDNFLKGVIVQFDITYPQYFSMELQRYHWIDIVSSQSKMHRLTTAATVLDFAGMFSKYVDYDLILRVKEYCEAYNKEKNPANKYLLFMKALSNLPMGFELQMTISTNYLQLKTIYNQRKGHKLKEDWGTFCAMCESLPHFMELIGKEVQSD